MDPTIVLNYGKSMRLPFEASNLDNFCAIGTPGWREYVIEQVIRISKSQYLKGIKDNLVRP
jgi:hypothetical protein